MEARALREHLRCRLFTYVVRALFARRICIPVHTDLHSMPSLIVWIVCASSDSPSSVGTYCLYFLLKLIMQFNICWLRRNMPAVRTIEAWRIQLTLDEFSAISFYESWIDVKDAGTYFKSPFIFFGWVRIRFLFRLSSNWIDRRTINSMESI